MSVRSRPVEKAAHSAPRELLTTRRILRETHASTDTVEDSTTRRSIRAVRPGSVRGREPDTIHQQRSGIDLASRINLLWFKRS